MLYTYYIYICIYTFVIGNRLLCKSSLSVFSHVRVSADLLREYLDPTSELSVSQVPRTPLGNKSGSSLRERGETWPINLIRMKRFGEATESPKPKTLNTA